MGSLAPVAKGASVAAFTMLAAASLFTVLSNPFSIKNLVLCLFMVAFFGLHASAEGNWGVPLSFPRTYFPFMFTFLGRGLALVLFAVTLLEGWWLHILFVVPPLMLGIAFIALFFVHPAGADRDVFGWAPGEGADVGYQSVPGGLGPEADAPEGDVGPIHV